MSVDVIYLDFVEAFGKVDHNILFCQNYRSLVCKVNVTMDKVELSIHNPNYGRRLWTPTLLESFSAVPQSVEPQKKWYGEGIHPRREGEETSLTNSSNKIEELFTGATDALLSCISKDEGVRHSKGTVRRGIFTNCWNWTPQKNMELNGNGQTWDLRMF